MERLRFLSVATACLLVWISSGPDLPALAQTPPKAPRAADLPPRLKDPPTLAGIDVFGNTTTPTAAVVEMIGLLPGDEVTPGIVTRLDQKLNTSGKFAYAKVSSTVYGNRKSYLMVDIVEKGEEGRMVLIPPPTGNVNVPKELLDWVVSYEKASVEAFRTNPRRPTDIDQGHYLDSDERPRKYENQMLEMVPKHYTVLVKALKEDKDPVKRALCARLLGWSKDKKAVIAPLQAALKDPDVDVRANAARSLIPIAYYSVHHDITMPLEPILEQIHYPTSSDRTKALALLLHLAGNKASHATIKARAGGLLVQMAGAKLHHQRNHALTLLTLISGEDFGTDADKWQAWWASQKNHPAAARPKSKPKP